MSAAVLERLPVACRQVLQRTGGLSDRRGEAVCRAERVSEPTRLLSVHGGPEERSDGTDLRYHPARQQRPPADG